MLTLGGILFDGYSTPSTFPLGGKQAMAVHKLPGGSRVIDTLGPDEADIHWNGFFFDNNALAKAKALDAMRAAGAQITLTVEDQSRTVVIEQFIYHFRRYPVWIDYEIVCTVVTNPNWGNLTPSSAGIGALVQTDVNAANAVGAGGPAAAGTPGITQFPGLGFPGFNTP